MNGPHPTALRRTFAALRHPNYRYWFTGQLVSLFGTWMQSTAQGFLVYELTQSPAYLGYVGFASGLPSWLFMLYGGVVSDRLSRRRVLLITQAMMMALALALAVLTFTNLVRPWHVIVLAGLLGLANAFDAPARQAFVSELVEREDLTNAIALNTTIFNTATATGPALAGLIYEWLGPGWCFLLNAASFVAVIGALLKMRLARRERAAADASIRAQLVEGLAYVARDRTVRLIIAIVGLASGFGFAVNTVLPAWTVNVLHGDARVNGLLYSIRGAGALVAALVIASLVRPGRRGRVLTTGMLALPCTLLLFAAMRSVPAAFVGMALVGASFIMINNMANALVQTSVPDALRGRVMGIYTLTFFGVMPIGSLIIGALAERFGAPFAVTSTAVVMAVGMLAAFFRFPALRRLK